MCVHDRVCSISCVEDRRRIRGHRDGFMEGLGTSPVLILCGWAPTHALCVVWVLVPRGQPPGGAEGRVSAGVGQWIHPPP